MKIEPILGLLLLLAVKASGQSVQWNNPGPLSPNEPTQIELVFTDCQPAGSINLPTVAGVDVLGQPGRATSFSLINFQSSSSTTLTYAVVLREAGRTQIPAIEVATDKGKMTVAALILDGSGAAPKRSRAQGIPTFPFPQGYPPNQGQPAQPQNSAGAVQAIASVEPRDPYAGQIFDVSYRVAVTGNRSGRVKTTPLWDVQNFTAEAWDRGQQIGAGGQQGLQFHTRAMIPKAGLFDLPAIRQKLDLDSNAGGRSFFFTVPGTEEVEVSSDAVPVEVKSLPAGAPAEFKGAVGQFTMESRMVPEQVNEGEPVTWTLTLRGTGNWPMGVELPGRPVPKEIRTIQPKLRREFNGPEVFTGALVEDLVLIPVKAGEYQMPAVKFVYFDPKKKSYETIEAKPPKMSVTRGASGLSLSPSGTGSAITTSQASNKEPAINPRRPAKALQYGEPGLPRESVPGRGFGLPPIALPWLMVGAILPWVLLLGVWWRWAQQRAHLTDPERTRKDALQAWKESVNRVKETGQGEEDREPSLLLWQKSVARTLGLEVATPSWSEIMVVIPTLTDGDRQDLESCWMEAEGALYGKNGNLEGDWCDRAMVLASRIDLPPVKRWEALRPRNLLPWLTLWLFLFAAGSELRAVEETNRVANGIPQKPLDPQTLYREGDFEAAGKIWEASLRQNPYDPTAKNNLGLAYFQLGEKERALAYGLAAYLVSPGTKDVGWNTRIFSSSADQLDPAIARLWDEPLGSWLTSLCGVLAWQGFLTLGIVMAATGVGLWLASGYYAFYRKILFRSGSSTLLLGALVALVAASALGVYGKLADREAVMVVDGVPLRSVPTEVEPQAEKAYPPGSIAHLEKSFLGWSKIRLPNQDAGWIRSEHIVPLY